MVSQEQGNEILKCSAAFAGCKAVRDLLAHMGEGCKGQIIRNDRLSGGAQDFEFHDPIKFQRESP